MDRAWLEAEHKRRLKKLEDCKKSVVEKLYECKFLSGEDKSIVASVLDEEMAEATENPVYYVSDVHFAVLSLTKLREAESRSGNFQTDVFEFLCDIGASDLFRALQNADENGLERYLDSEPQEFDGDIIITDPCYVARDSDWDEDACGYGSEMQRLGLDHSMTRDTLYGDWGCTVYDDNTGGKLGEFCADAGMVGVFLLDEVLAYNPSFDYHKEKDWTTTWIKDFKGTVQFVVEYDCGVFGEDSDYAGQPWEDYSVVVVGHGVNKMTGERIDFRSKQTSL